MKNFFFVTAFVLLNVHVFAQQNDPKATAILDGVSKKYKSYKAVQADFTITIASPNNTKDVQSGTLYVKGSKYKLVLSKQEITSDDQTVWTYIKAANEVQINDADHDESVITPSDIFTIYEKNFFYAYTGDQKENTKTLQIIELTPNDKTKAYSKVKLFIDKASQNIESAIVYDKNGNQYTYAIKKLAPNPDVDDTFFTFDSKAHPGVKVEDLR
jgi:outer membrane lipoprotein-sorting protein